MKQRMHIAAPNRAALRRVLPGFCVAILLCAASARADSPSTALDDDPGHEIYLLSARLTAGLGGGGVGIGGRLGLSAEYWLTRVVGVGIEGGVSGQVGFGAHASARYAGPAIALRTSPQGGTFFTTFGVAYASADRVSGLSILASDAPAAKVVDGDTYAFNLAAGWLGHPGRSAFEIGPVVRLQAVGPVRDTGPDFLLTVNLELGFALLEGSSAMR